MDAVGTAGQGNLHAVVDHKGDAPPLTKLAQLLRLLGKAAGLQVLLPNLEEGGPAVQHTAADVGQALPLLQPCAVTDGIEQHGPADFIPSKFHILHPLSVVFQSG